MLKCTTADGEYEEKTINDQLVASERARKNEIDEKTTTSKLLYLVCLALHSVDAINGIESRLM